jgi:hypothetical protein
MLRKNERPMPYKRLLDTKKVWLASRRSESRVKWLAAGRDEAASPRRLVAAPPRVT